MGGREREGPALCLQGVKNTRWCLLQGTSPHEHKKMLLGGEGGAPDSVAFLCTASLRLSPPHLSHRLLVVQNYHHWLSPLSMVTYLIWPPSDTRASHLSTNTPSLLASVCSHQWPWHCSSSASGSVLEHLPGGTLPASPLKSQAAHLAASSRLAGFLQVRVWQPGTQMPLPVRGNESVTRSWDSCLLSVSTWLSHRANLKTHSRSGLKPRTVAGTWRWSTVPKAALRSTAEASLEGKECLSVGTAPRGGK